MKGEGFFCLVDMRERRKTKKRRKQFLSTSIGYDMANFVEMETKEELKRKPSYMTFYSLKMM